MKALRQTLNKFNKETLEDQLIKIKQLQGLCSPTSPMFNILQRRIQLTEDLIEVFKV